jgi:Protein of unknown function (DUF3574)
MPLAAALLVALGLAAFVAYRELTPAATGCGAGSDRMARVELLFGMGRKGGGEVSEEDWRAFLEVEVTPRFPDGLTVLTGYGQWRNATGTIAKETSRVLLMWARPAASNAQSIEAIRTAWKVRFQQDSVMRVDGTSCVSF